MALSSALNANYYTGDGATTVFAYGYRIISSSDLRVVVRNNTTDVETTKVLNTDYTVSGVGAASGGNVTFTVAPTSGHKIAIERVRALTQTQDIRNQGDFYPETHENAFDHFVMLAQQLQEQIDRCLRLPDSEDGATATTRVGGPATRASKYLAFDSSGNIVLYSAVTLAPYDAQYVTLATNGTLTNERVLTGTANQITITDNGAGSTVVLSTPQNIHTSATPTFAGVTRASADLTLSTTTSGDVVITPAGRFESRSTTAAQMRLAYTTGSVYADEAVNSSGYYSLTATGFRYSINTATALGAGLDLAVAELYGGASGSNGARTNATLKTLSMLVPHYTNASGTVSLFIASADTAANTLQIGGGGGGYNALTRIQFYTGATTTTLSGSARWEINSSGHLLAGTDNAYDIGASGATRPRTGYFGTQVLVGTAISSCRFSSSYSTNGEERWELRNSSAGTGAYGHLFIGEDNAQGLSLYSINSGFTTSGLYVQDSAVISAIGKVGGLAINSNAGGIGLWISGSNKVWEIAGIGGHLLASTDNSTDIGASGATRPRTLYLGTSINVVAGAVLADTNGITMGDAKNIIVNATTGTKIGTATSQKLGFWNATPIAQPSTTGETTGFTAGAGTTVRDDSTFTGNVGATAYRISDIVKHLKNAGLIAS